ncbi:MAG: hypothetical protein ACLPID_18625 [Beijerinckiaceae bacterium]
MDRATTASPFFMPRLNFATADSELAGISLDWGDCAQCREYLLIALQLSGFRVTLVLIDANWKIVALLQIPIVLKKCHPDDKVGALRSAKFGVLKENRDSVSGLLCVEQAWHRKYSPDPPRPGVGGTILSSWNTNWYRFECRFRVAPPVLSCECERTESERFGLTLCSGGENDYWLSSTIILPPPCFAQSSDIDCGNLLEIAEADANGLPVEWRQVRKLDWARDQSAPSRDRNRIWINGTQSYDRDNAVCLVTIDGKLHLVPLRLADGEALTPRRFALPSGWRSRLAWSPSPSGGGAIWFYVSNEKLSATRRDRSLWRIDYGPSLLTAKRASDAIRVTRLSEDRVMTRTAILDYGDMALVMWEDGMNITRPNILRCFVYRRADKLGDNSAIPIWTCEAADDFLTSLPIKEGGESHWMGKPVLTPDTRKFPRNAFKFGKRFGAAVLAWHLNPYRTELTIGEIKFAVTS